jgi:hypothetical protein
MALQQQTDGEAGRRDEKSDRDDGQISTGRARFLILLSGLTGFTAVMLYAESQSVQMYSDYYKEQWIDPVPRRRTYTEDRPISPRQSHCDSVKSLSGKAIPHNLLFNSKDGLEHESILLQQNVKRYESFFPGWNIIDDSDNSCLEKLQQIDFINENMHELRQWWNSPSTPGMYKSDVGRLPQ